MPTTRPALPATRPALPASRPEALTTGKALVVVQLPAALNAILAGRSAVFGGPTAGLAQLCGFSSASELLTAALRRALTFQELP